VAAATLASAALGLGLACHEPAAPTDAVGVGSTFVLVMVGYLPLPAREAAGVASALLLADTIVFTALDSRGSGSVEHRETIRTSTGDVVHSVYYREFDSGGGILSANLAAGKVLTFYPPPCPPLAACSRFIPETGHIKPDLLTITYGDPSLLTRIYVVAR
jgi:phage tail protein X